MAGGCCYNTNVVVPRFLATKTRTAAFGLRGSQVSTNASFCISVSCSISTKASEAEMGIICCRDEKGEMFCERYDDGPRYQVQPEERQQNQRRQMEIQIQQLLKLRSFRDPELDSPTNIDSVDHMNQFSVFPLSSTDV